MASKYWEERAVNAELQSERSVLDFESKLLEAYEIALASIRKEIEAFYGRYAKDNKIPYAEVRRRLTNPEYKNFNTLLKEWLRVCEELKLNVDYSEYLKKLSARIYLTRLEALEANIRYHIEVLKAKQHDMMEKLAYDNYMVMYYQSYFNLAQNLGIDIAFYPIDHTGIMNAIKSKWDRQNFSSRIWNDRDALIKSLSVILPQSFSRGFNANKLGDMISKEMGTSKNRGRALARTEINYLCNQATLEMYKKAGIEKYEFLATLDTRTSDICRDMDGYIGKVSEAKVNVNYPPMHVNCRSTTVPYFEDDKDAQRIARDEEGNNIKVSRRMTQEEWIKKYVPKEQQETMLNFRGKYRPKD